MTVSSLTDTEERIAHASAKRAPLKVLIVSHACASPQNQALYARAARVRGWEVTLCLPEVWQDDYGNELPGRLLAGFDAQLVTFPVFRNGSIPLHGYRGRLTVALRRIDPDVIFVHNEPYAISTLQWVLANQRTLRRPIGFYSAQNIVKRYPLPFRQAERWVHRKSSFCFPVTKTVMEVCTAKGYEGNAHVLPLGYDEAVFRTTQPVIARHLHRPRGDFTMAYVGRLVEEKGLLTLAKALGKVKLPNWRLVVAGKGPFEDEFRKALRASDVESQVDFVGFVDRDAMGKFLESVDLLLVPSETRSNWCEQFGRVLIESMACGTPVIGSDSGEIPNLIAETGGGVVFREAQPDELAKAIEFLGADAKKRSEMADAAQRYVATTYSLEALATRFADCIEAAA